MFAEESIAACVANGGYDGLKASFSSFGLNPWAKLRAIRNRISGSGIKVRSVSANCGRISARRTPMIP